MYVYNVYQEISFLPQFPDPPYREHTGICCGDRWVDVQQWATTNTGANLDRLGKFNNSHPSCSLHHNFKHSCIRWLSRIVVCLHSYMLSYRDEWFYWGSHALCKVWAKRCYFFKNGPQTPVRGGSAKESVFRIRLMHTSCPSTYSMCLYGSQCHPSGHSMHPLGLQGHLRHPSACL